VASHLADPAAPGRAPAAPDLVLRADRAFTAGDAGMLDDAGVVVRAGRIAAVAPFRQLDVPAGAAVWELGDRTLLPGLVDAHAHVSGERREDAVPPPRELRALRAAEDCERLVAAGFTTVRDCGGTMPLHLRVAIREGSIVGPRFVAAGPFICQTGSHFDHHSLPLETVRAMDEVILADGADQCRQAVRRAVRAGADFIKICTTGGIGSERDDPQDAHFTDAELAAIVDEAHRLRRRVASHAQGRAGILTAVRAGVDSIEHGYWLDEECLAEMKRRGTHLVPTFALVEQFRRSLARPETLSPWRREKQPAAMAAMERAFALWHDAPLVVGAGPDSLGTPGRAHGDNADEAITMVAHGMAPERALRAATIGGATVCGLEAEIGSLVAGKRADVIAVDGDPVADVAALRSVALVVQDGIVRRAPADA
jgi:imidazolonepropionase-like amidohydrolase